VATGHVPSSAEVLRLLPASAWSRAVGRAAELRLPPTVVRAAVRAYVRVLGVEMGEAAIPTQGYETFGEFFARRLRPGARVVDGCDGSVVSPCDGTVLSAGDLAGDPGHAKFFVKGRSFSVADLTDGLVPWLADEPVGGHAVIYLSPADYHRVHCPVDGVIQAVHRIPGTCMPVNRIGRILAPWAVVENERVIFDLECSDGPVCVVMVGALGVCGIQVSIDDAGPHGGGESADLKRGDEIGVFNLGSTVVVLWSGEGRPAVAPADRVSMGQRLVDRGA